MKNDYPFYKGLLPTLIIANNGDGITYPAKLNFIIKKDRLDIKKYLDFRNKLDKLGLYFVDTDTGSRKRRQHNYIYIWTLTDIKDSFGNNYEDYIEYLKLCFPIYSIN